MSDHDVRAPLTFLNWAIGLLSVWLSLEALSLLSPGESPGTFRYVPVLFASFLLILALVSKKVRASSQSFHLQELEELRREVEKTALRYKNLLEGAGDAIFVVNAATGKLEEMNDMGSLLLGYSREELGELAGRDLVPDNEQARYDSLVRRISRCGAAASDCLAFRRKDGSRILGEVSARLIDLGGEEVVQAIIRDITQKKEVERELRKRNRKLSILNSIIARANASLDLHTVLDVTLQETMEVFGAEAGAIHLLENGRKLSLVAGKNLTGRLRDATRLTDTSLDPSCRLAATSRCSALSGLPGSGCRMAWHIREDGWGDSVGIPLFAKNDLIGVMHIMTRSAHSYTPEDVNFFTTIGNQIGIVIEHARIFAELNWKSAELLRSHRLLEKNSRQLALSEGRLRKNLALVEEANLELERLDRMKGQFLGMISHEFKTPLTAILCSSDFLLTQSGKHLDADTRRLLNIISQGGTVLNEIVTDLLKVMRLEAKASPVSKTALHLEEILSALFEQFDPVLRDRRLRVRSRGIGELPHFCGDKECLHDILARLLENAVKFTPDGGEIVISAALTDWMTLAGKKELLARFNPSFYDKMGNAGYLQVEVRDSGVGIDPGERLKVFDTFYEIGDIRHHTSGKHKFQGKGAGLGLAIVKGMIEAHGGMVWAEAPLSDGVEQEGSSFFLLIPLEDGPSQEVFPFMHEEALLSARGLPEMEEGDGGEGS
jgi:PAS domain S-box-containing protein